MGSTEVQTVEELGQATLSIKVRIPARLLRAIEVTAFKRGISRSDFLAQAAAKELGLEASEGMMGLKCFPPRGKWTHANSMRL